MWIDKIIYRKYGLHGYNNPTEFFNGIKKSLPVRRKGVIRIYFLGLPDYGNMGDQAIACAMTRYVRKFGQKYEIFTCNKSDLLSNLLSVKRDCQKGDILFLIGGGNMGVAYFGEEEVRRLIIEMFPKNRIIIFPQTIDYGKSEEGKRQLKEAIRLYSKHKDLHIFAREKESYQMMKRWFSNNHVYLAPDIVFSMQYEESFERSYILKCIRNDRESALNRETVENIDEILQAFGEVRATDTVEPYVPLFSSEEIREKLVYRKLKEFAMAKLVITDRLHGVIFSVLTNTPCIVMGNNNHKIKSSYETWLGDFNDIVFMEETDSLPDIIRNIKHDEEHVRKLNELQEKYKDLNILLS